MTPPTVRDSTASTTLSERMILFLLWATTVCLLVYSYFAWDRFEPVTDNEKREIVVGRKLNSVATTPVQPPAIQTVASSEEPRELEEKAREEGRLALSAAVTEMSLDEVYSDLFSSLRLDPARQVALRALLVKRQVAIDAAFNEQKRIGGQDEPAEWDKIVASATAGFVSEFRELLGDEGLGIMKDYFETQWLRMWTRRFQKLLHADRLSLSLSAREKLVTSLAKANPVRSVYPSVPEETILDAKSFLSPREHAAFQSLAVEINGYAKSYELARKTLDDQAASP